MEPIRIFNPSILPPPVGFSRSVAADGVLWVAGHTARNADGDIVALGDLVGQIVQALRNVGDTLATAGCRPSDILTITYLLTDMQAYRDAGDDIRTVVDAFLGGHLPATTLLGVSALHHEAALVEIQCVARHAASLPMPAPETP